MFRVTRSYKGAAWFIVGNEVSDIDEAKVMVIDEILEFAGKALVNIEASRLIDGSDDCLFICKRDGSDNSLFLKLEYMP